MIRKYTPAAPIIRLPGDSFIPIGNTIEQWRGGHRIAIHNLAVMPSHVLVGPEFAGSNSITAFYVEHRFMITQELTSIEYPAGGGENGIPEIIVTWNGDSSIEYGSRQGAIAAAQEYNSIEVARGLKLAQWLAQSPDLSDPSNATGTVVLDPSNVLTPLAFG